LLLLLLFFYLSQLKVERGPTFPSIEHEYKQKKIINELAKLKKSCLVIDSKRACRSIGGATASAIPCEENEKTIYHVVHQLTTGFPPHLTWARIRGATQDELDSYFQRIKKNLPEKAVLLMVLCPDTTELRDLHKLRTTRADPRCSLMWDKMQQINLETVAMRCQRGLTYVALSSSP
jgi:RNA exonuclease 1